MPNPSSNRTTSSNSSSIKDVDEILRAVVESAISNPSPARFDGNNKSEDKTPAAGLKPRMRERKAQRSMMKLEKKQRRQTMNNQDHDHDNVQDDADVDAETTNNESQKQKKSPLAYFFHNDHIGSGSTSTTKSNNHSSPTQLRQQETTSLQPVGSQLAAPIFLNKNKEPQTKELDTYVHQLGGQTTFYPDDEENPNSALLMRGADHPRQFSNRTEDYPGWNHRNSNHATEPKSSIASSTVFVIILGFCIFLGASLGGTETRERSTDRSISTIAPNTSGAQIRSIHQYPSLPSSPPAFTSTSSSLTHDIWTEDTLLAMLKAFTHTEAFQDPSTPQGKAFQWLHAAIGDLRGFSSTRVQQRYALASIYYSLQNLPWKNTHGWLTKSHECSWHGVMCGDDGYSFKGEFNLDDLTETVTYIDLSENNIEGALSLDFNLFPMLAQLNLAENLITGSIPDGLFTRFKKLRKLLLNGNLFEGTIPDQFNHMESIEIVDFGFNSLRGQIPLTLSSASNLVDLRIGNNELSGEIPSIFSWMSGLEVFMAGNNELIGTIPIEIGRLSSLRIVELYENKLTGNIPDFVSTDLRQVHVDNNDLSGTIPFFDDGVPLEQIRLERNRLHGNLPIRLGDHTDLVVLHLNGNGFSGIVPHEYGRLEHLESFKLEGNTLTGTVPESICELILFHSLSTFNPKCDGSNVAFICDCCTACH